MKTAMFVAALALAACRGKTEPAPTETSGSLAETDEWSIGQATSSTGNRLVYNLRPAVPAGITPAEFGSRVTVRCPYSGHGTDSPTAAEINELQDLEERLASPSALLLMSKTGDGAREMNFQVKRPDEFVATVPRVTKEFGGECTYQVVADYDWSLWRRTIADLRIRKAVQPPAP